MRENLVDSPINLWRCLVGGRRTVHFRRYFIVVTYAWLLMNVNSFYPNRAVASLMLSRMINRSILNSIRGGQRGQMSTAEAIALIQAINSGRNNNNQQSDNILDLVAPPRRSHLTRMQGLTAAGFNRQLPVPVPVPLPTPLPVPPVPVPIAVIAAIVAAFIAATFSGFPPLLAIISSIFAAAIAIIIAFLSIFINIPAPKKDKKSPLIKKLVIKKTVLPFVIPIPLKSKEKKIIYKPVPVHHHHEKEVEIPYIHESYEYKEPKLKKKHDTPKIDHQKPVQLVSDDLSSPVSSLKKIERLIVEQDHIQKLIDQLIEKENRALGVKPIPPSKKKH